MIERHEEILEALWACAENDNCSMSAIRGRCAVEFSEQDIAELAQAALLVEDKDRLLLTAEGQKLARAIIRRHRLAEVLVTSILMVKHAEMEDIACRVEHSLQPEVEEAICTLLGHPEVCPDGKPIPRGLCCTNGLKVVDKKVVSLYELGPGESGKITYIKPISHSNLHQLISFGLQPGVEITVHRQSPAFCIKFANTELALDEKIVRNIFVWKLNGSQV